MLANKYIANLIKIMFVYIVFINSSISCCILVTSDFNLTKMILIQHYSHSLVIISTMEQKG